ncbi:MULTISPECIES: Re/Si-specific NAD(P)(+) transhydrogenase subunit alpha [unclassified Motilimonas]|uniref:Re/Si-specific NAD(P)(+) transhydrogenase subunit alpha n=1 Tax=Motilimonas TaxID=1914248 RepID=UPI001E63C442|nr:MULTISPECIES: Re/Si-specific NAD(P)(+) transhydrogenase subunit alpha [unclassified Motilimonas]MCE0556002.1 Re/Si-specific NAD(P)(+) transhydrogenase subunit alpha [Motilimonas sp. E26]MDO6526455.1 Re/Si-specific NAD(P)(+) transhydrogenase subunit alpha [Motilimonas sp. 1_MG-2023]
MQIGVPKELLENETRVAATPKTVEQLLKLGFSVSIEASAGQKASFNDQDYVDAGATLATDANAIWQSDVIFKVNAPTFDEIDLIKDGATLISFIWPAQNEDLMKKLSSKNINVLAMDAVPRISRAQALDALSSMANIAGYRAVIEAANQFGRFFTGQITAAGKVPPAKVLVVGAGVAGLAAIGAAGSLGAIVRATDTRPEVAEQIESMGAEFLKPDYQEDGSSTDGYAKVMSEGYLKAQAEMIAEQAKDVDIIITTALIPGRPAPLIITEEMVMSMKTGSVIVDLAAQTGGNCAFTENGKVVEVNGVKIVGYSDLPGRLPTQSSQLYGTNLVNLMKLLCKEKDGNIDIDFEDEVLRGTTVVKEGEISWPPPAIKVSAAPAQPAAAEPAAVVEEKPANPWIKPIVAGLGALAFFWIADSVPSSFLSHFTVFVLACVVGYGVVWNVSHSLHTPLMSVTNAISGIIVIGALLQVGSENGFASFLAFIGVLIATINIVGGFTVTQRMLKMFTKD